MAEISVEGLGIIEIEGDSPNEQETLAILNTIRGLDQKEGIQPLPPTAKPNPATAPDSEEDPEPAEGPLGLVPADVRGEVRRVVKSAPGIFPFLAEIGPATIGTGIGATLGASLGPPGVLGGGILGGIAGEFLAQETGVAPASEANLALAGAGPLIGRGVGAATRLAGRAGGKAITMLPPARVARARVVAARAARELQSLGARILEKQKGLLARPAKDLYRAARKAGVKIAGGELVNTRRALVELRKELLPNKAFPEVAQALAVIEKIQRTLTGRVDPSEFVRGASGEVIPLETFLATKGATRFIDFEDFIRARQNIGVAIRRATSVEGVRLGGTKKVFAAMSKDLDDLAQRQPTKRAARLAKAATQRAKIEFAVRDVERLVARFTTDIAGEAGEEGITINAKGLLKAIRDLTNPKSKKFDKNFVDALGDQLPAIQKNLNTLVGLTGAGSPGGPGSIVVRGITARMGRTVIGGLIGFGTAGALGAGAGALIGASGPEMLTALLMSKPAMAFLEAAARAGRGEVSRRAWMIVGQILTRGLGEREETTFTALPPMATTNEDFLSAQAEAGF